MTPQKKRYAVCLKNPDALASLETRKIYEQLDDSVAASRGFARLFDESGEDYLFPSQWFAEVAVPEAFLEEFAHAG